MSYRRRLFAALTAVAVVPAAVALLISDASIEDEILIGSVAAALGLAAALVVSRVLTQPVAELAEDVERARREAAEASRDEMRASVQRLGEALRSTHDLVKLLSVVLDTALTAVRGASGAVFLFSAHRSELTARVARHVDPILGEQRLPVGRGLAGWVAEHGEGILLPSGRGDAPVLADPEPIADTAIGVPLLEGAQRVLGVIAIYGSRGEGSFRTDDLDTLTSLANQAAIGIDNVLLHQEAERLSITDGLTSIWNHRYFQMEFSREFASAKRFATQFSLLWVDLDDFKKHNDTHGHQRGDAILIELASRLSGEIREVDTLARYGGEEFILILPQIDREGARLAAERVRRIVAERPFGTEGEEPITVTISVGYATYPDDGETTETLLNAADKAMYVAKARGKDQVVGAEELRDQD